jgi:hypothetical protein
MSFMPITISRDFRCVINTLFVVGIITPFVFITLLFYYYDYYPYQNPNLSPTIFFGGFFGPLMLSIISYCIVSFLEKIKLVHVSREGKCWCTLCSIQKIAM